MESTQKTEDLIFNWLKQGANTATVFPSTLRYCISTESLRNLAMRELMHANELANIVQISLQRSEKSLASFFLPGLILHS